MRDKPIRKDGLWKEPRPKGGHYAKWRGFVHVGPGQRRKASLLRDFNSSKRRLGELQREADREAAGLVTADTRRLALPIGDLAKQYIGSLESQNRDADHVRISRWMLERMIEFAGWRTVRDVTVASVEAVLPRLGKSVQYRNKFVVRIKAFVHWVLPDGAADPLVKLKRAKERGVKGSRDRRAASAAELVALFGADLPVDRKLAYALAAFNGLRRNEARRLCGGDLRFDGPVPFLGVRRKQGEDDSRDFVPLHPYVLGLLNERLLMPAAKVLPSVPDMKTMCKDLERAGVPFVVDGRRLDFHALRHTFATNLDRCGCSRATKKRLMRHANEDVTDGYAHAELAELAAALSRVPSPVAVLAATGTDGQSVVRAGTNVGQNSGPAVQGMARVGTVASAGGGAGALTQLAESSGVVAGWHGEARADLIGVGTGDIVAGIGPSTQAD